jgi:hypothetical protein
VGFNAYGASGTVGAALVNTNDPYVFAGLGKSYTAPPLSLSYSFGVVENYGGVGSYKGGFTSVTTSSPLGFTIAGNPRNPQSAVFYGATVSSSVGGPSQFMTYYWALRR